jgi:predicted  nucleic acid-binding Zn-ribbon protein
VRDLLLVFQAKEGLAQMIGKSRLRYLTIVLSACLAIAGCEKFGYSRSETEAQRIEAKRLEDQKERAALIEQVKAAAIAQEQKQAPIKKLQAQIDALQQQISDARSRGKDWRALEKSQEALEAQKAELQRQ